MTGHSPAPAPLAVGMIGAGRIASTGHLPAYAAGGVPIAAICSRHGTTAHALAERATAFGNRPRVYATAAEVAADPAVQLLDVVTPPHDRLELIRSLLPFGKPLLVQKPLAYSVDEAATIVAEAAAAGVPLAVNHNARWWSPQHLLSRWIAEGRLGDLVHIANVHHFSEDRRGWDTDRPDYLFVEHGIHFLDLARRHAGTEPIAVAARAVRVPGQLALSPLAYTIMLRFDAPLVASLTLYNATRSPAAWSCHWHINGTRGDAHATYTTATLHAVDGSTLSETPPGDWVPDGLLAAYATFVAALHDNVEPEHSAADHLHTLALATAAAQSAHLDGAWIQVPAVHLSRRDADAQP